MAARKKTSAIKKPPKHLLGIQNLSVQEAKQILKEAKEFISLNRSASKKLDTLRGKTQINLFFEPSTRTQSSFDLAGKRLGADVMTMNMSNSALKKGETLIDTAMTLNAMHPDLIVIRHQDSGAPNLLSQKVNCAVINAGDGTHEHPTQALLDSYTIREKTGKVKGKRIAIIGDITHSRVALSNIYSLQKLGAEVMLCGPSTLIPKHINNLNVKVENDIKKALKWCDVANVLRIQLERQKNKFFPSLREYSLYYGINKKLLDSINRNITIMHPGPINRGVEISSDVADSKNSIILDQVENGVAIRMAVMYLLSLNKNR